MSFIDTAETSPLLEKQADIYFSGPAPAVGHIRRLVHIYIGHRVGFVYTEVKAGPSAQWIIAPAHGFLVGRDLGPSTLNPAPQAPPPNPRPLLPVNLLVNNQLFTLGFLILPGRKSEVVRGPQAQPDNMPTPSPAFQYRPQTCNNPNAPTMVPDPNIGPTHFNTLIYGGQIQNWWSIS